MFIEQVASRLPDEQQTQLLKDLSQASVDTSQSTGSLVRFHLETYVRPPYGGQRSFGIGAQMKDLDGVLLSLDLYADHNDRLLELEIIRWENDRAPSPDWDSLEFF